MKRKEKLGSSIESAVLLLTFGLFVSPFLSLSPSPFRSLWLILLVGIFLFSSFVVFSYIISVHLLHFNLFVTLKIINTASHTHARAYTHWDFSHISLNSMYHLVSGEHGFTLRLYFYISSVIAFCESMRAAYHGRHTDESSTSIFGDIGGVWICVMSWYRLRLLCSNWSANRIFCDCSFWKCWRAAIDWSADGAGGADDGGGGGDDTGIDTRFGDDAWCGRIGTSRHAALIWFGVWICTLGRGRFIWFVCWTETPMAVCDGAWAFSMWFKQVAKCLTTCIDVSWSKTFKNVLTSAAQCRNPALNFSAYEFFACDPNWFWRRRACKWCTVSSRMSAFSNFATFSPSCWNGSKKKNKLGILRKRIVQQRNISTDLRASAEQSST